jgi:hypothetical protein
LPAPAICTVLLSLIKFFALTSPEPEIEIFTEPTSPFKLTLPEPLKAKPTDCVSKFAVILPELLDEHYTGSINPF